MFIVECHAVCTRNISVFAASEGVAVASGLTGPGSAVTSDEPSSYQARWNAGADNGAEIDSYQVSYHKVSGRRACSGGHMGRLTRGKTGSRSLVPRRLEVSCCLAVSVMHKRFEVGR